MSEPAMFTPSTEYQIHLEDVNFQLLIQNLDNVQPVATEDNPGLHSHEFSEMFICISGTISLMTETGPLDLHEGEAAVVLPGVLHKKMETKLQTEWYTVSFSGTHRNIRDCGGLYRKLRIFFDGDYVVFVDSVPNLATDIRRIEEEFRRENKFQPPLLLISLLLKMANSNIQTKKPISTDRPFIPGEINRLMRMDEIIEGRYKEVWNAQRVSEAMHISLRQVDRISRKRYGKPFRQALMDKRSQIVAHLLSTTNMTVRGIINLSGFSSVKSMYREFRKRYGMTPTEYRRRHEDKGYSKYDE